MRCVLAKERSGCLSLWSAEGWEEKHNARVRLVEQKLQADSFGDDRIAQVQLLGRLLSTRHQTVELGGRSRLLVPEGFRKFLGVERDPPENEVLVVGAAVCVEIWKPAAWQSYLEQRMPASAACFIGFQDRAWGRLPVCPDTKHFGKSRFDGRLAICPQNSRGRREGIPATTGQNGVRLYLRNHVRSGGGFPFLTAVTR